MSLKPAITFIAARAQNDELTMVGKTGVCGFPLRPNSNSQCLFLFLPTGLHEDVPAARAMRSADTRFSREVYMS